MRLFLESESKVKLPSCPNSRGIEVRLLFSIERRVKFPSCQTGINVAATKSKSLLFVMTEYKAAFKPADVSFTL